jgi:hypothetical protein
MGCLQRALGIFLAVVFVLVLPAIVAAATMQREVLDSATYTDALEKAGVYEDVLTELIPAMIEDNEMRDETITEDMLVKIIDVFGNLDSEDWYWITGQLIPDGWLRTEIEHNVRATFEWLEGDAAIPDWRIDVEPVRTRILGPEGRQVASRLIQSWDTCTDEEMQQVLRFLDGEGEVILCRPEERYIASYSAAVTEPAMDTIAEELSGRFILYDYLISLPESEQYDHLSSFQDIKYGINLFKQLNWLWYVIPTALLALIVIAVVRNANAFFKWMGWTLLVGGIFSMVLPMMMMLTKLGFVGEGLVRPFEDVENERFGEMASHAVHGAFQSAIRSLATPMLFQAMLVTALGFGALVLVALVFKPAGQGAMPVPSTLTAGQPIPSPPPQPVVQPPSELETPSLKRRPFRETLPPPPQQARGRARVKRSEMRQQQRQTPPPAPAAEDNTPSEQPRTPTPMRRLREMFESDVPPPPPPPAKPKTGDTSDEDAAPDQEKSTGKPNESK